MFQKHGKRNVLLVFAVVGIVGGILGYVGAKSLNVLLVFVSTALHGASLAPFVAAIFTFASDIIDYLELKTGERYEGLVTSVSSIGSKAFRGTGLRAVRLPGGLQLGRHVFSHRAVRGLAGRGRLRRRACHPGAERFERGDLPSLHRSHHRQRCVLSLHVVLGYRQKDCGNEEVKS